MDTNKNRVVSFDILRIIAAFAVVFLHISAQRFSYCYPSLEWCFRNIYDSMVRWSVPVFIMISGALFLDKKKSIDLKKLYAKNILHLVFIYFVWSFIYELYQGLGKNGLVASLSNIVIGPYHFWFLKTLIGLYIVVPILRVVVENPKIERYLVCLSVVTVFFLPVFFYFIGIFSYRVKVLLEQFYSQIGITIASGYASYFVLGHYLNHHSLGKTTKRIVYALGLLSFVAVCVLSHWASSRKGYPELFFYRNLNLFTLSEATAIFVFIKDKTISPQYHKAVIHLSQATLGIYIIHPLLIYVAFDVWGIDSGIHNPVYFIPLFASIIFLICYLIVGVVMRVPVIKKLVT